jgi:hypothetical protein
VGDFTVNGTFTTTGTDSLEVNDPFIFLANANPGDTYDTGVISQFYDGAANRYTGLFRDITDNKYKLFGNLIVKPTTTVDTGNASFTLNDLVLSNVSATGNVNAAFFVGNGAALTGISTDTTQILNGNSKVIIAAAAGNIVANVGGTTIATISSSVGLAVTGAVNATLTVSATGNITGGNITTAGIFSATGNITSAANVSGGNLLTGGLFSAFGGITGGNVSTGGAVSATANVTGGNVLTAGIVSAGANVTGGNIRTAGIVSATGAVYGDSFSAANGISAGTTVAATTDVTAGGSVSATGAVNSGGTISAVGNITGSYIFGNGSQLTGIDSTGISFGTSNVKIVAANANATISIGGTANVAVYATTGEFITGLISATGNVIGGNVSTGGVITATGNITGGNVSTGGVVTVTGNVNGGNVNTVGLVSAGANVIGGNISTVGVVTATGNVTGGNIITAAAISAGGLISATGTVTGGNLDTNGTITTGSTVSATGNVTGGNFNTAGLVSATGNLTNGIANVLSGNAIITSLVSGATISASGNVISGNLNAVGLSLSGNVVSSLSMITNITTTANIAGGNISTAGISTAASYSATGNITGGNVLGGANVNATTHTGATVSVTGNITGGNVLGGANVNATTHTGATVSVTGNITGGNVSTGGLITATGNITGGNIVSAGVISATSNAAGAGIQTVTIADNSTVAGSGKAFALQSGTNNLALIGNITNGSYNGFQTTGDIAMLLSGATVGNVGFSIIPWSGLNAGIRIAAVSNISTITLTANTIAIGGPVTNIQGNGVGNIGNATGYFNTVFAKATSALYADLAENYSADASYAPGTVLSFGGSHEVTIATQAADSRVAGIVSTHPAHLMNSMLKADHVTALALTGRVPALVIGTVRKGDMMVTAGNGHAQACATPAMGTVIGKAVEDFNGHTGTIEIVVGRI